MKQIWRHPRLWNILFLVLPVGYALAYAPYGINETDGGFLTGLAWQVLSGKTLYQEIVYVRPPLPVWLRTLELYWLPDTWAILGERWIFYLKVAVYSWMAAGVLAAPANRGMLAAFSFLLSVHCYPPVAWHTTDGILFGVFSIWLWHGFSGWRSGFLSGVAVFAALICKQSFYPFIVFWLILILWQDNRFRPTWRAGSAVTGLIFAVSLFAGNLYQHNILQNYLQLTGGAASIEQAVQHGILDYIRINPALLIASMILLGALMWARRKKQPKLTFVFWAGWLAALGTTYAWTIYSRQEFTVPFAQTRLLFWVAGLFIVFQRFWGKSAVGEFVILVTLMGLSWCASVSWGYNLPILLSTPWVYVGIMISRELYQDAYGLKKEPLATWIPFILLLLLFRYGYTFVYRDGNRQAMTEHMGDVFPQLTGIWSTAETIRLHQDLKQLTDRYGPVITVLPAFPQANYLTRTNPPLPLDWVVEREMGAGRLLVEQSLSVKTLVCLVQKSARDQIQSDPELDLCRQILQEGLVLEETEFFLVIRPVAATN
ncbi:MAG: hypothetical protein EP344_16120 [Bacteroidetes bacterium]|nr:MAG: hypothetical protein EP344_16120 [Bacteroidota bacterium]